MLKFLRKNTKAIVWTVVIAFVAWGGYAVRIQLEGSNRAPGRIFGKDVLFREYLSARQIVQLFYARAKDKEIPSAEELEARTWQFLILSHEAKHRKVSVTDDEVRREVAGLWGNERMLALTEEQYFNWVRRELHSEPREFEDGVRENLRVRKLLEEIRKGFPDNPDEHMKGWIVDLMVQAQPEIYRARA